MGESLQSVFELALENQGPERTAQLLKKLADQSARLTAPRCRAASTRLTSTRFRRSSSRRIPATGRWSAASRAHALERHGDGGEGQLHHQRRRAHLDLRLVGDALRSGAESFFPRPHGGFSRRPWFIFKATPRRACMRGPFSKAGWTNASAEFPAGTGRGRRAVVVSASVSDAGFLAVPDGLDGAWPDHVAVSGAVQPLPAGARPRRTGRKSRRSGRSSATANRTSRNRSAPSRSARARTSTTSSGS